MVWFEAFYLDTGNERMHWIWLKQEDFLYCITSIVSLVLRLMEALALGERLLSLTPFSSLTEHSPKKGVYFQLLLGRPPSNKKSHLRAPSLFAYIPSGLSSIYPRHQTLGHSSEKERIKLNNQARVIFATLHEFCLRYEGECPQIEGLFS